MASVSSSTSPPRRSPRTTGRNARPEPAIALRPRPRQPNRRDVRPLDLPMSRRPHLGWPDVRGRLQFFGIGLGPPTGSYVQTHPPLPTGRPQRHALSSHQAALSSPRRCPLSTSRLRTPARRRPRHGGGMNATRHSTGVTAATESNACASCVNSAISASRSMTHLGLGNSSVSRSGVHTSARSNFNDDRTPLM